MISHKDLEEQVRLVLSAYAHRHPGHAVLNVETVVAIAAVLDGISEDCRIEIFRKSDGRRCLRIWHEGEVLGSWDGASVLTGMAGLIAGPPPIPRSPESLN